MAGTIEKGITITFRGDTTSFDESVKKVNSELRDTKSELSLLNKELKLDPTNFEKLSQKMDALKDKERLLKEEITAYQDAMQKLDPTSEAFKQAEIKCRNLEIQIQQTRNQIEEMGGNRINLAFNTLGAKVSDVGSSFTELGKKMAGLSATAGGLLAGFGKLTYDVAQSADEINTLAKQTGLSTDTLQVFGQMAELIDVDLNTLAKSAQYVTKNLKTDKATKAYKQLGVAVKNTNGEYRSSEDILMDTIKALQKVENEADRTELGTALLGKTFNGLGSIVNDATVDIDELTQSVKENVKILSQDELKALNDVNDNIDKMKQILGGMGTKIASEFSEPTKKLTDKIVELAKKLGDFVDKLDTKDKERILGIIAIVATVSPLLLLVGGTLTSLGTIVSTVGTVISTLTTIVKLMNLAFGANPIGAVIVVITALVGVIVYAYNNSETFRNAVLNLWIAIKDKLNGVIESLKTALDNLKNAIQWVKDKVVELWDKLSQTTFVKNITSAFTNLKDNISNARDKLVEIIDKFKNSTFAQGFIDTINKVKNAVKDMRDAMSSAYDKVSNVIGKIGDFFKSGYEKVTGFLNYRSGGFGNLAYASGGYGTLELNTTINVNNNGSSLTAYDAQVFGREIVEYVNDKLGRRI